MTEKPGSGLSRVKRWHPLQCRDMFVSLMSEERVEPQILPLYTYIYMYKEVFHLSNIPIIYYEKDGYYV